MDPLKVFRSSIWTGVHYYTWGIIKRRICVENVPGVEMLGIILSNLMDPCPYRDNTV